jgi:hypothetical protein
MPLDLHGRVFGTRTVGRVAGRRSLKARAADGTGNRIAETITRPYRFRR